MKVEDLTQEGWYDDDVVNNDKLVRKKKKGSSVNMKFGPDGSLKLDSKKRKRKMKENNRELTNFTVDEFVELVADDSSWVLAEDAEKILLGEDLDGFSNDDIGIIADIAHKHDEQNLYNTLSDHVLEDDQEIEESEIEIADTIEENTEVTASEHDYGHKKHVTKKKRFQVPPYDYKGREEHSNTRPNRIVNNQGDNPMQTDLNRMSEEIIEDMDDDEFKNIFEEYRQFVKENTPSSNANPVNWEGMRISDVDDNRVGKVVRVSPIKNPSAEDGNPRCVVWIIWPGAGATAPIKYLSNSIWYNSNRDVLEIHERDARREYMTSSVGSADFNKFGASGSESPPNPYKNKPYKKTKTSYPLSKKTWKEIINDIIYY